MHAGKLVGLTFAVLFVLAAGTVAVYKVEEARLPPILMSFERVGDARNATAAGNATSAAGPNGTSPVVLPYQPIHAAYFIEDHLDEAAQSGNSSEPIRLRVDLMRGTLADLTHDQAGPWLVAWHGAAIRITLTEGPDAGARGTLAGHVDDAQVAPTTAAPAPTS